MNKEEPTEKSSIYRLDFFQGEVDVEFEDKAKAKPKIKGHKIFPDVEYWEPVLGMRIVDELKDPYFTNNPVLFEFYSNYWVEEGLYSAVLELCKEQSIDHSYVDDLCVPLSNFRRTNFNVLGNDNHIVAENTISLRNAFEHLNEHGVEIVNISLKLGKHKDYKTQSLPNLKEPNQKKRDVGFDPRFLEDTYYDTKSFNVSTSRALLPLTNALRKLPELNEALYRHLNNPDLENQMNRSPSKFFRLRKDRMMHIVYRFLVNNEIARSTNEARGITGLLVSLVDSKYAMSEDEFLKRQTEDLASYSSRKAYFADVFKHKMNEFDK
ncbi:MAG: hypothetical protein H6601_09215 [Flavobacteriales bacterium]|nr:hypothetical protein [Flavobacteriales bacterium]